MSKFFGQMCVAGPVALLLTAGASAQIASYSQDFESMNAASATALGDDGWLVGANVFDAGGGFVYNYFAFPAPNGSGAFSNVATGEGGPAQGAQQLVTFSDYNNGNHGDGSNFVIESNVFREYLVGAGDVGTTQTFTFDAKRGDLGGSSTAVAFIKTLDQNNGFALTSFVTVDLTAIPTTWGTYSLSLAIDPSLQGQIFQIGFYNTASNFSPSGVFYDNINLTVPAPASAALLGLAGLGAVRRRR